MKLRRILRRLDELLDAGKGKRRRKVDELMALLKRLKKKQRKLEIALGKARSRAHKRVLRRKLKVVRAHRRKGLLALRALRVTAAGN